MKRDDRTVMGGPDGSFHTTVWSEIRNAGAEDPARRRAALEPLLARYWKPVYCCLRRKGCDNDAAKDLTQRFFHEVLLGRDLIRRADPAAGRFRTFLRSALDRFIIDVHREEAAQKRSPQDALVSLHGLDDARLPEPASAATPEDAFDHAWAAELLDGVLAELESELRSKGMAAHWELFAARVVRPIMNNIPAPDLASLCKQHGIGAEVRASNMILTAKRHFQLVLRHRIRELVDSDAEVDDEISQLMHILSRN